MDSLTSKKLELSQKCQTALMNFYSLHEIEKITNLIEERVRIDNKLNFSRQQAKTGKTSQDASGKLLANETELKAVCSQPIPSWLL